MVLRRAEHILLLICSSTYVCMSMMTTHAFSFSHQHARGVEPFLTTRTTRGSSSPLFVAITPEDAVSPNLEERTNNVRKQLRRLTGFSLTAARATLRVTTGVSSQVTKRTLSIFPLWLRFFFQPFLVLYYWPLILLRGGSGQNQSKQAVDVGEQTKTTSTGVCVCACACSFCWIALHGIISLDECNCKIRGARGFSLHHVLALLCFGRMIHYYVFGPYMILILFLFLLYV